MEVKSARWPVGDYSQLTKDLISQALQELMSTKRERPSHVHMRVFCGTSESFDKLCENLGGIAIVKLCMLDEGLVIHVGDQETLDYINTKLDK